MEEVQIEIARPALTIKEKQSMYKYCTETDTGNLEKIKTNFKSKLECSSGKSKKFLYNRIPALYWIPNYNIRKNFIGDLISGMTVSVMHLPQGMAYAFLAGLAPVYGLYTSFFPGLIYALLGTSKHISVGTMAVIGIMTGKVVTQWSTKYDPEEYISLQSTHLEEYFPNEVAAITAFTAGFIMLTMGILQLGTLTVFFSDILVSGFTTGAAIHVLTSQLKNIFGLTLPRYNGPLKLIWSYKSLFENMHDTNLPTLLLSTVCIILLIVNNEVIKPKISKYTKIPIPFQLIVILIGTIASTYGMYEENYGIDVVGDIPTGLPMPTFPPFKLFPNVFLDSFFIVAVSYALTIAMGKKLSKNEYKINPTQELFALGTSNIVGSLFSCFPISASMSRSLVQVTAGGVTQAVTFVSGLILLMVFLFIAPFFETLPNCVLSSIIITALRGMLFQVLDVKKIFKISLTDGLLWLFTFFSVVIIDIDYGLFLGVLASLLILIYKSYSLQVVILGRIKNTDLYLEKSKYKEASSVPDFKLIEIRGSLHYANQHILKKEVEKSLTESEIFSSSGLEDEISAIKHVIIDLSKVSSIDSSAWKCLDSISANFAKDNISIVYTGLSDNIIQNMDSYQEKYPSRNFLFHSVHDAITILSRSEKNTK